MKWLRDPYSWLVTPRTGDVCDEGSPYEPLPGLGPLSIPTYGTREAHQKARRRGAIEDFDRFLKASAEASAGRHDRVDGLTPGEGLVMDHLCAAVTAFSKLERQHPDEMRDFADGIHRCQDALAVRIARRHHPIGWPVKPPATAPVLGGRWDTSDDREAERRIRAAHPADFSNRSPFAS